MIAAKDIDALYIPLPTGLRKDYILAAVAAGKHVLCEKPCGVNAAELREIIDACAAAGVQFMDGVMFMHSDRLPRAETRARWRSCRRGNQAAHIAVQLLGSGELLPKIFA